MKRTILSLVLPLVIAIAAVAPSTAAADGSAYPAHQLGSTECGTGYVKVWTPRQMLSSFPTNFRNPEMVTWSPDLHRWNGSSWQLFDGTRPWYRAFTSSYGYYQNPLGTWQNVNTNMGTMFVPYFNLPRGYYAIKNFMRWGNVAGTHAQFSPYCYVG